MRWYQGAKQLEEQEEKGDGKQNKKNTRKKENNNKMKKREKKGWKKPGFLYTSVNSHSHSYHTFELDGLKYETRRRTTESNNSYKRKPIYR